HIPGLKGAADSNSAQLDVPVPSSASDSIPREAPLEYEVTYTEPLSSWAIWDRLFVTAPKLPVDRLNFRHYWQLPPGVQPLDGPQATNRSPLDSLRSLLNPVFSQEPKGRLGEPWNEENGRQRDAMAQAEFALRSSLKSISRADLTLGTLLEQFAFGPFRDRGPLIIDKAALDSAQLKPD